jgi:pyruvate,water dikinase
VAGVRLDPEFVVAGEAAMSAALAGGKGAALAKLGAAFPVPAFFVITPGTFDETGPKVRAWQEIDDALNRLGPGPYAVRSSALEEDGAQTSHAGQFLTELNVARADIYDAARRVFESGYGASVADYRRVHGKIGATMPAVVVQVMVAARAAGVAFSADPVSGARDVVVISAVEGLADKLVGGEVDGDSYRVGADGRSLEAVLAGSAAVLSEAERAEVAALARRCEMHFGSPQDIEWAFDASGLKLLQSRPITTLAPAADSDLTIWDNSNIVESYPGVVSPLTFSFARYVYAHVYQAFAKLMGVSARKVEENRAVFENMLGTVDGRVYYNLLNWYRALALFPGFKANRAFMEGMMGVSEALPQEIADRIAPLETNGFARFADNLNFARVGLGLVVHEFKIKGTIRRFYARLNAALARPDAAIDAMPAVELAAEYRRLEQSLLAKWDAPLVNDFLCMIAFGASQKAMTKWAGDEGLAFLSNMLIGQGDIVSAEPARRIKEMGAVAAKRPELIVRLARGDTRGVRDSDELAAMMESYIAKFGDRCTQELKLESLTLHEDPSQVLMAIAAAARSSGAERPKDAVRPLSDVVKSPLKRMQARWLLKWAKARVRDRENLRFERTRLFGRVRRIFLAIGARLAEAGVLVEKRDVFMLTVEEALGAVEGAMTTNDLKALAALRKTEQAAERKRPDPPERFSVRGAHAVGLARLAAKAPEVDAAGEVRKGLACCKGIVTAKVRVVEDPRREALQTGEILVARHTDPGWIAVFANAAGVIAERGSLLSHSAIVAREMGVPCVVSLKGVTTWLRTGDTVRLDGGAGTVERLARGDE